MGGYLDQTSRLDYEVAPYEGLSWRPISPEFVLHQCQCYAAFEQAEVAIFSIDEFVRLSRQYGAFGTRDYVVRKGTHRGPGVHQAPRFGFVQFQRAGNKQHPTQLQFNLEAGYFNKLPRELK